MKPCSWSENFTKAIGRGDKAVGHVLRGLDGDYRVLVDDKQVSVKKRHFDAFFESEGQKQMATLNVSLDIKNIDPMVEVIKGLATFYSLPWYKRVWRSVWLRDPLKLSISTRANITN